MIIFRYSLLLLPLLLAGCQIKPLPAGGSIRMVKPDGTEIHVNQPQNAEQPATLAHGEINASTGNSRKDPVAGLKIRYEQYQVFTYIGAVMVVVGIGMAVASFWFPLIPKLAGVMVAGAGVGTAYLSTAIPDYAPYAMGLAGVGLLLWLYHQRAAKRDPNEFKRRRLISS